MRGRILTAEGQCWELPVLLEWELCRTGGIPCDSFSLECPYEAQMHDILRKVCRFEAWDGEELALRGVVDEWSAAYGSEGLRLHIEGRGMAALLLDNESERVNYQYASVSEILRRHVEPYGIVCGAVEELRGTGLYSVESGSSEWKALSGFTRRYGGFEPWFSADGRLWLQKEKPRKHYRVQDGSILAAEYREKRYGVISEMLVLHPSSGLRQSVRNDDFCALGGSCRRVLYSPSRVGEELRYTGEYQIAESEKDARQLELLLSGSLAAQPGDRVEVNVGRMGLAGSFCVEECLRSLSGGGETTRLRLRRE